MKLSRHEKQTLLQNASCVCPFCSTVLNLTDSSHVVVADKTPKKYRRKAAVEEFEALEDLDETIEH